jgi:hypothetical protein
MADHIPDNATTWGPDGIVVEHRYIADIVRGALADSSSKRPSWMEGMSLQNQVREIVWEQFRALRRVASVKSVAADELK